MTQPEGKPSFQHHFDGSRYYNPGAPQARNILDVLRWKLTSRPQSSPRFIYDVKQITPPASVVGNELRATFVNHSTVLLQQNELNILTDPIWAERASPVVWAGPRRRRQPGIRLEDLPRIDVVLLSHNHYDHLDLSTLHFLARRGSSTFVAPTGVARLLRSQQIKPVHELGWGASKTLGVSTIHCVPAFHFSGRGIFDRNKTLWCGYVIQSPGGSIYFAADTAFGNHFNLIRDQFGPMRLSLLPIGSYEPRWFMAPIHMSPEDALEAHRITRSRTSIAIHHGTFQLGDDGIDAAKERLLKASPPDSFVILNNGESARIA
jgi:L-ascorbate metabolism protein UlaG (beta-lactamase superfamily)